MDLQTSTESTHGRSGAALAPAGEASSVIRQSGLVVLIERSAGPSMTTSPALSSRTASRFRAVSQGFSALMDAIPTAPIRAQSVAGTPRQDRSQPRGPLLP